jgi:subtilisin family serine protease
MVARIQTEIVRQQILALLATLAESDSGENASSLPSPAPQPLAQETTVASSAASADSDPAAPAPAEVSDTAGFEWGRALANLGGPADADSSLALSIPQAPAVSFDLTRVQAFLRACETSIPRVGYGLGKKVPSLAAVPGRDFTRVDCSGFVREAVRLATTPTLAFPDGSVVQHDWVIGHGFERSTVADATQDDGVVRIAFLRPQDSAQGIGHVVLISGGKTVESHGGVGPDSRVWDGANWQAKMSVYVFARSGEVALPAPHPSLAAALTAAPSFTVRHGHRYAATVVLTGLEQFASNDQVANRFKQLGFIDVVVSGSGSARHAEATWNGVDTTAPIDPHLRDVVEIPASPDVAGPPDSGLRSVVDTTKLSADASGSAAAVSSVSSQSSSQRASVSATARLDTDKLATVMDTIQSAGYAQVLVKIKKGSPLLPADPAAMGLTAAVEAVAPENQLERYFILPQQAQPDVLAAAAAALSSSGTTALLSAPMAPKVRLFPRLGFALGFATAAGVEGLAARADVEKVMSAPELSLIRPVARMAAGEPTTITWGIQRLKADLLWEAGITGKDVIVGHLDTGVDGTHPALANAIADFVEFDLQGNRVPAAAAHDSGEHGTHTAGTILGRATGRGAFGMAPDAKLASALVIEGGNVVARILGGMEWIIEKRVRILSMSLGLRGYTTAFQAIVDALRTNGVLPIFAAGNEGVNTSRSPGNYGNVLAVGAMASDDSVPDFSSSQQFNRPDNPLIPDLVSPGVGVLSCIPGGGYAQMDGTSTATPHVAGLAALLLQAAPNASPDDLENAIQNSCALPPTMIRDRANRGVPDAVVAFQRLTGGPLPQPPVASAQPRGDTIPA